MKKEEARRNKRQRKLIFQFQFLVKIQIPVKTGSLWRLQLPQIFAKVDLLPIGNDSEKKKNSKKLQTTSNSSKTTGNITLAHSSCNAEN